MRGTVVADRTAPTPAAEATATSSAAARSAGGTLTRSSPSLTASTMDARTPPTVTNGDSPRRLKPRPRITSPSFSAVPPGSRTTPVTSHARVVREVEEGTRAAKQARRQVSRR